MKELKTQKTKLSKAAGGAISNVAYPLAAFGIVLAVWSIAAAAKGSPLVLPMPDAVFAEFFRLFALQTFWRSLGYTIARALIAFVISFALAMLFAVIGGLCKPVHRLISPIVGILRAAPTMAVILVLMLWLDYAKAPSVIGFFIAFPVLYPAFYTAVTGVDKDLVEMVKIYRVKPWDKVVSFYLPSIAPSVFDASRSTVSLTFKVVIAAEVLCYTRPSVGLSMQEANISFEMASLLAWTVAAILLSFVFEGLIFGLKKLWEVSR